MSGGYATRRLALVAALLPAALWAACLAGRRPSGEVGSSARTAPSPPGSPPAFRPHVEFEPGGATDWGNLRLVVRVVLPFVKSGEGPAPQGPSEPALAHARRMAATLAAGVRVDSHDTVAALVPDAGALKRWTIDLLRPLHRRVTPEGEFEGVYEIPLTGEGAIIARLHGQAFRKAAAYGPSVPEGVRQPLQAGGGSPLQEASGPVMQILPANAEGRWGVDWSLRFLKGPAGSTMSSMSSGEHGRAAEAPSSGGGTESAAAVVIDARGTGLAAALFPVVLDERGERVYDAAASRSECVVRGGLVRYVEVDRGADLASLGVVKAAAAEGPLRANPVLSFGDARRLRAEKEALHEARVVIVLDAD